MNRYLGEEIDSEAMAIPGDVAGTVAGGRIDMGKGDRLQIEVNCDAAAQDLVVTLQQHDAASGGNSKALQIDRKYFYKLAGAASKVKVDESGTASDTITVSAVNGTAGIVEIELLAEDLDVNGGFSYVSASLSAGGAKVCSGVYKLFDLRNKPA